MISPCKCIGSVKYVHILCLKKWFYNKININSHNPVISILWDEFKCEICKTPFPLSIPYEDKIYKLLEFNEMEDKNTLKKKILTLEYLSTDNDYNSPKGIFIIDFSKNKKILIVIKLIILLFI